MASVPSGNALYKLLKKVIYGILKLLNFFPCFDAYRFPFYYLGLISMFSIEHI